MIGATPPLPQHAFMAWCLLKAEGQLYFYLLPIWMPYSHTRMYPKVSGLSAWSENWKWYSSLPLGAVVSLFFVSQSSEVCRHNLLYCFSTSVYYYCCLFRYPFSPETFVYTLVISRFFTVVMLVTFDMQTIFHTQSVRMIYLPACLSIHPPTYLPTTYLFIYPSIHPFLQKIPQI
jgi:hypothetical protein